MKQLTLTIVLATILTAALHAQVKYHASYSKVAIEGTSTLHDWDMASEKANCDIAFSFDGAKYHRLVIACIYRGCRKLEKSSFRNG